MQFDKNVPMPEIGARDKYRFKDMDIGDSFLAEDHEKKGYSCKAYNAAIAWGKRNNAKFVAKKQPGNKVRIWRVQ